MGLDLDRSVMQMIYLAIPLACLVASIVAGLFGRVIGRKGAHSVTILGVAISFALSIIVFLDVRAGNLFNGLIYTWGVSGGLPLEIGFLVDELSAMMMVVVSFVSFMVHIYTIGYMHDDAGYQRFFSYISLFTFAMLMLVMSNNFLQLFFGWEAVGLVSYLLIGFWFDRESAIKANLKAFLVNRVGDFGFLLGIAAIAYVFGTLDYTAVFSIAPQIASQTVTDGGIVTWVTLICLLLFVGAMGKSAQVPLHVWLPDSMEGPTPISALIHAATMVTAGIFMVARMSPLFELSEAALTVVMLIGGLTAFSMALVGMVQNDIKRVVAYSTLSQLGYMTAGLGASAYAASMFHLGTHAFFKALLFLAAGSVIIALHHEQDMRKMGGLRRAMPITWLTAWIGTLALIGFPGFAGFFSKDGIIEAVHLSQLPGSGLIHVLLTAGVFVTAFYSVRLMYMTFHGKPRMEKETFLHVKESPWVVTLPLVLLAVPSIGIAWFYTGPMLFGDYFGDSIKVLPQHDVLTQMGQAYEVQSTLSMLSHYVVHAFKNLQTPAVYLMLTGAIVARWLYHERPDMPAKIASRINGVYQMLLQKYGFDEFYDAVFARGARYIGGIFWREGDARLIDGWIVNGSAKAVGWVSSVVRYVQTGYVYHYAFAMIIGLVLLITFFLQP